MKLICLALIFLIAAGSVSEDRRDYPYTVKVFISEGGWGYDILLQGRTIIRQPYIPVISGSHPFKSRGGAEKAGRFAAHKLRTGRSPGLTYQEIRFLLSTNSE